MKSTKKPSGKDARAIRKMLREGMPPASIPFSPKEIERIFRRLPDSERLKIAKRVHDAEVEVVVTDEQADKLILSTIASRIQP